MSEGRKVWVAYVNDEGPSLRAFETKEAAMAYAVELDRIVTWRSSRVITEENEDEEVDRRSLPPEGWVIPEELLASRHRDFWDGAVVTFDLPLGGDPIEEARKDATDWNAWGEFEP